jgi:hypothetical protein
MNVMPQIYVRPRGKVHVPTVTLAHGGGGKAMKDLIDDVFVEAFDHYWPYSTIRLGSISQHSRATEIGSRSPPTPSSSILWSFPAATSASSRSAGPSTILQSAERSRCTCLVPSSSKKESPSISCARLPAPWQPRHMKPA